MAESINFLDPNVLSGLDNLELRARVVVEGFLSGLYKSPNRDSASNSTITAIISVATICVT